MKKALNQLLPRNVRDAISDGAAASATIGAASVEVLRFDWPTGKGYELKVLIE